MNQYKCWCYECLRDEKDASGWPVTMSRMILCPDCGNKRCPRATDHNNACTNSNEPNQEGSRYSPDYKSPYDIGKEVYNTGRGISDIWSAVKRDADMDSAFKGYYAAQNTSFKITTDYNPDNYSSFNFDSMLIKQPEIYDPIVVRDINGKDIFRINQDGNIFWNGREIKGDEELVKATTEFMRKMTECMIKTN